MSNMHTDGLGQVIQLGDAITSLSTGDGCRRGLQIVTNLTYTRVVANNSSGYDPTNILVITSNLVALGRNQELDDARALYEDAIKRARTAIATGTTRSKAKTRFFVVRTDSHVVKIELAYATENERRRKLSDALHKVGMQTSQRHVLAKPTAIRKGTTCWYRRGLPSKLDALTLRECIQYGVDIMATDTIITNDEFNAQFSAGNRLLHITQP